jgi:hypothetical protein
MIKSQKSVLAKKDVLTDNARHNQLQYIKDTSKTVRRQNDKRVVENEILDYYDTGDSWAPIKKESSNNFHVVYHRGYDDPEDGYFENSWTVFRNIPFNFNRLQSLTKKKEMIKLYCDKKYAEYDKVKPSNFVRSRVTIIYDDEYYATYGDVFETKLPGYDSYYNDYGQNLDFMLKYDFGTFCRSSEKVLDEKGKI